MTHRTLRLIWFSCAAVVLALVSALGAAAVTGNGTAAAAAPRLAVVGNAASPTGTPTSVTLLPAVATSCQCQAEKRVPPPPPAPPAITTPFIYAGAPQLNGGAPSYGGKVILVSLSQQWMWGYDNGTLMLASPVTTGMPQLPTPTGVFNVFWKVQDTEFISPWPKGSPYYYTPEHVNYALEFKAGGFYLHDAPWRICFGPGTNVPHTCPGATVQETGSHGCVNMPTPTGAWVYAWAPYGTTVVIRG